MSYFDVAIIGSGPAGASAAYRLAEQGISTVLIEKETLPRYKTCGGGFVYRGRRRLPYDISEVVEREFKQISLYFEDEAMMLTTKRDVPVISMVMRDDFDSFIIKKAKEKGVLVKDGHKLTGITFGDVPVLHTDQGDVQAKMIIAADGALSPTAKMAGWKETRTLIPALEYEVEVNAADFERLSKEVRFDVDTIPYGYAWSFPKENHLSLGVASARKVRIDLKAHYRNYLTKLGITEVISEKAHGFQIPVAPRTDGFYRNKVFLIGDAAGFADPITAEGISNALLSGEMVVSAMVNANLDPDKAGALYESKLEEELLPEILTGVKVSKWFYSQRKIRNFLMKRYGDYFISAMTDVFIGERSYPKDLMKSLKRKVRELV
ncbi:geranylgeranyl reductase family protein [Echinicola vietnamensis]|uniref:Geranylgeranyl reductase family protein n=1 Tax=Echinicola vietnamensis (strain DSM 17526 / LMG 23754 / KMM 6221) TaxID=926556 RepID=L0G1H9_ECHVK|nr:geranylgeranyl reductase family protein [Echinicola vietnamensis]AGA79158.1 geranylgeranyl reductase family protein [Echinicola vietnamensis DSM 17526]